MTLRTRMTGALAAGLLLAGLAIGPSAASAAKRGHPHPAGAVVTRSTTIQLPPHQLLTATATCPPGTRAVGGGFSGAPGGIEPTVVTESRRSGGKSWIASGLRASPLTTATGSLTAIVRCRSGAPKIGEVAASTTLPAATGPGDHPRATTTATCPGKRRAISGGFSSEADPKQALTVLAEDSHRVSKGRSWSFTASHNNPAPRRLTATPIGRGRVGTKSGSASLTGDLTTKSADSQPCGGGRVADLGRLRHVTGDAGQRRRHRLRARLHAAGRRLARHGPALRREVHRQAAVVRLLRLADLDRSPEPASRRSRLICGFRMRMQPCEIRPGIRFGSLVPWMPITPPPGQSLRVGE